MLPLGAVLAVDADRTGDSVPVLAAGDEAPQALDLGIRSCRIGTIGRCTGGVVDRRWQSWGGWKCWGILRSLGCVREGQSGAELETLRLAPRTYLQREPGGATR